MGTDDTGSIARRRILLRYLALIPCVALATTSGGCVSYGEVMADAEPVRADGAPVTMPPGAPSISQGFKPRRAGAERQAARAQHDGIDIRAAHGTPVIAPAPGRVRDAYFSLMYGRCLVIDHGHDARGRPLASHFFHLAARSVAVGQAVRRGQQIGTVGMSGLLAGFPHLHFEIRRGASAGPAEALNPHLFWQAGVGVVTCYDAEAAFADAPFATTFPVPCRGVGWR